MADLKDDWQEHVLLEISDAYGYPARLIEIQEALMAMDAASLIPDGICTNLFLYLQDVSGV